MTRAEFNGHMAAAANEAAKIEKFIKGEFRDIMEEKGDLTKLQGRFKGIALTLGGRNLSVVLNALHTEEQRLGPILQNIQSHMVNAIADINFCKRGSLSDVDARTKAVAAEGFINSVIAEFRNVMEIDNNMFHQTTQLKNTHDVLVVQLEKIEEEMHDFTSKLMTLTYALRTNLIDAVHAI